MDKRVAVFLRCQNRLARESITRMLQKKHDINVVAVRPYTSKGGIEEPNADVVVLDSLELFLEDRGASARPRDPEGSPKNLLIAMADEPIQFLRAIRGGAIGYILQDASAADVVTAIRAAARGEAICPPQYTRILFDYVAAHSTAFPNGRTKLSVGLTNRERQLVPLIEIGLTNKEIAARLNLSEQTVKNHVHRILSKLGVDDRLDVSEACQIQAFEM